MIAPGRALELPSLFGVEDEYVYNGGTTGICELAKSLLRTGIGTLADWKASKGVPVRFVHVALRRWVDTAAAGGHTFGFGVGLLNWLDEWSDSCKGLDTVDRLYLVLDTEEPHMYVIGKLYESLYRIHPRLPASFYQRFIHGCNRWFRTWDHKDMEFEIQNLEEQWEDQNDKDTVKIWKSEIPRYMRRKPLPDKDYDRVVEKLGSTSKLRRILEKARELKKLSDGILSTELNQDERDSLDNHGNSYPVFSLHFFSMDSLRGLLDSEGNLIMQTTPMPQTILPFTLGNDREMLQAFTALSGIVKVIALASQIVKHLPESD